MKICNVAVNGVAKDFPFAMVLERKLGGKGRYSSYSRSEMPGRFPEQSQIWICISDRVENIFPLDIADI